jgi:hypothetical protein
VRKVVEVAFVIVAFVPRSDASIAFVLVRVVAKRFVEVAFVVVPFVTVRAAMVDEPDTEMLVTPVKAPLVTSHELEFTSIWSPPSPIVSVPAVDQVAPEAMVFEPIVPPVTVSASVMYPSPIVVDADTAPELFVVRTPAVCPRMVSAVRYAFAAVSPVVEAYDDEANAKYPRCAVRPVVDAFVDEAKLNDARVETRRFVVVAFVIVAFVPRSDAMVPFAMFAFCAVRPVVDAYDDEANAKYPRCAVRPVVDAFVDEAKLK